VTIDVVIIETTDKEEKEETSNVTS
jgi:hypothetical protein